MSRQAQTICPCLFVHAVAGREMLRVPYVNCPWCCHSDMVFWLGFAPLAFGCDKNLYHKAVVYNSAWQGRQTPWGVAIPAYHRKLIKHYTTKSLKKIMDFLSATHKEGHILNVTITRCDELPTWDTRSAPSELRWQIGMTTTCTCRCNQPVDKPVALKLCTS